MNQNKWSEKDLIYFAGFFDGEGCFNIRVHHPKHDKTRSHYMCRICVTNTDKRIMDWMMEKIGGNFHQRTRATHYKPVFHWSYSGPPMTEFIKAILPFLLLKKEHAETMIKFRNTFTKGNRTPLTEEEITIRSECIEKLHFLNRS